MSSAIRVVEAGITDADALSTAGERFFVQAYGKYSEPDDLVAHVTRYFGRGSIAAELQNPQVTYTMALDDDVIAGFIKIRRGPAPPEIPASGAIEVQQLYVGTDQQGKGVGRTLMDHAVDIARAEGSPGLWLSVWQDADWATGFYEACGFRKVGIADFWLGRTRFTDYLMWLALNTVS